MAAARDARWRIIQRIVRPVVPCVGGRQRGGRCVGAPHRPAASTCACGRVDDRARRATGSARTAGPARARQRRRDRRGGCRCSRGGIVVRSVSNAPARRNRGRTAAARRSPTHRPPATARRSAPVARKQHRLEGAVRIVLSRDGRQRLLRFRRHRIDALTILEGPSKQQFSLGRPKPELPQRRAMPEQLVPRLELTAVLRKRAAELRQERRGRFVVCAGRRQVRWCATRRDAVPRHATHCAQPARRPTAACRAAHAAAPASAVAVAAAVATTVVPAPAPGHRGARPGAAAAVPSSCASLQPAAMPAAAAAATTGSGDGDGKAPRRDGVRSASPMPFVAVTMAKARRRGTGHHAMARTMRRAALVVAATRRRRRRRSRSDRRCSSRRPRR